MFSLRIVTTNHYQAKPVPGLDTTHSEFRNTPVKQVPVLRIFGSTPAGQKTCMHIHGVFPYLYVPYDGTLPADRYLRQFAASLDKALNVASRFTNSHLQHVYKISLVSGIPMYGYHPEEEYFLKIYLFNPTNIRKAADLLLGGAVMNKPFQPHESHLPFALQLFIDYNLYGMNLLNAAALKFRKRACDENRDNKSVKNMKTPLKETQDSSLLKVSSPELSSSSSSSSPSSPVDRVWHEENIPRELWLPADVERQSTCELEVDVVAADILNRHELASNIGANPGLTALWEDEKQRRRDAGDSSQLEPDSSQGRDGVVPSASEKELVAQFLNMVKHQQMYRNSQSDDSFTSQPSQPASQVESHVSREDCTSSSQNTLIISDGEDAEDRDAEVDEEYAPIVNFNSIQRVVSCSQSFSRTSSQKDVPDSQDRSVADILAALLEESGPPPSQLASLENQDSIMNQSVVLDKEGEQEEEEESLLMSQFINEESTGASTTSLNTSLLQAGHSYDTDIVMNTDDSDNDDDIHLLPQFDGASDKIPDSLVKSDQGQAPSTTTSQSAGTSQAPGVTSQNPAADTSSVTRTDVNWRAGAAAGRAVGSTQGFPSGSASWAQQSWSQQPGASSATWHGQSPGWTHQQNYPNWPQHQQQLPSAAFSSQQASFHSSSPATTFQSPPHNPYASPTHQQAYQTPSPSASHHQYQYPSYQSPASNQAYQQPYQSPSQHPYQSPGQSQTFHTPQSYHSSSSTPTYQSPSGQPFSPSGAASQPYQLPASNNSYASSPGSQPYQSPTVAQPYQSPQGSSGYQTTSGQLYPSPYQSPSQTHHSSPQQPYPPPYQTPVHGVRYPSQSSWCAQGYPGYYPGLAGSHVAGAPGKNSGNAGSTQSLQSDMPFGQTCNSTSSGLNSFPAQDLQQLQQTCTGSQKQAQTEMNILNKSPSSHIVTGPEGQTAVVPPPTKKKGGRKAKVVAELCEFKSPQPPCLSPTSVISKNHFENSPLMSFLQSSSNTPPLASGIGFSQAKLQDYGDNTNIVDGNKSVSKGADPTKISTLEFKPNIAHCSLGPASTESPTGTCVGLFDQDLSGVAMKVETSTPMIQQLLMEEPVRMNIRKEDREAVMKKPAANPAVPKPRKKYTRRTDQGVRKPGRPRSTSLSAPAQVAVGYCGYPQPAMNPPTTCRPDKPHTSSMSFNGESSMPSPMQNYAWQQHWKQQNFQVGSQWQQQQQQQAQQHQWGMNDWQGYNNLGEGSVSGELDINSIPATSRVHQRSLSADTIHSPIFEHNAHPGQLPPFSADHLGMQGNSASVDQPGIHREGINDKSSLSSLFQLVSDVGSEDIDWESTSSAVVPNLFPNSHESETPKSTPSSDINQGSPLVKDFITLEAPCKQVFELTDKASSDTAGMTSSEESDRTDLDLSSDLKPRTINRSHSFGSCHPRLGKQSRLKKLGLHRSADLGSSVSGPVESNPSYTYTFHVPTPVFKKLKFFRSVESRKHNIKVVRMHPMDARRYSLLKVGREIVKVVKLTEVDLAKHNASLPSPYPFVSADGSTNRVNLDIPVVSVDRRSGDSGSEESSLSKFDTDFPPNKVAPPSFFHAGQVNASLTRSSSTAPRVSPVSSDWLRQYAGQQPANYNGRFSPGMQAAYSPQHTGISPQRNNFPFAQQQRDGSANSFSGHQHMPQNSLNRHLSSQPSGDSSGLAFQQASHKGNSFYPQTTPATTQGNFYPHQPDTYMNQTSVIQQQSYYQQQQQYHQQQQYQLQQHFAQQQPQTSLNSSDPEPKNGLRSPGQHGLISKIDSGSVLGHSADQEPGCDNNATEASPFNTRVNAQRRDIHAEHMANCAAPPNANVYTNLSSPVVGSADDHNMSSDSNVRLSSPIQESERHCSANNNFFQSRTVSSPKQFRRLSLRKSGKYKGIQVEDNSSLNEFQDMNSDTIVRNIDPSNRTLENISVMPSVSKQVGSFKNCHVKDLVTSEHGKRRERTNWRKNVKDLRLKIPMPHSNQSNGGINGIHDSLQYTDIDSATSSKKESDNDNEIGDDFSPSSSSGRLIPLDDDVSPVADGGRSPRQAKLRSIYSKNRYNLKPKKKRKRQKRLIEGIHYIVTGKFRGHQVMLVKVRKLSVNPSECVRADRFEKLAQREIVRVVCPLSDSEVRLSNKELKPVVSPLSDSEVRLSNKELEPVVCHNAETDPMIEAFQSYNNTAFIQHATSTPQRFHRPSRGRSLKHGKFRSAHTLSTKQEAALPRPSGKEAESKNVLAGLISGTVCGNSISGARGNLDDCCRFIYDNFFLMFQESFTKHKKAKELCTISRYEGLKDIFFENVNRSRFCTFQQKFLANIHKLRSNEYSSSSDDEDDILDETVLKTKLGIPYTPLTRARNEFQSVKNGYNKTEHNLLARKSVVNGKAGMMLQLMENFQLNKLEEMESRSKPCLLIETQCNRMINSTALCSDVEKTPISEYYLDENIKPQERGNGMNKEQLVPENNMKSDCVLKEKSNNLRTALETDIERSCFVNHSILVNTTFCPVGMKIHEEKEDYLKSQMAFFEDISSDSDSNDTIIMDNFVTGGNNYDDEELPLHDCSSPPCESMSSINVSVSSEACEPGLITLPSTNKGEGSEDSPSAAQMCSSTEHTGLLSCDGNFDKTNSTVSDYLLHNNIQVCTKENEQGVLSEPEKSISQIEALEEIVLQAETFPEVASETFPEGASETFPEGASEKSEFLPGASDISVLQSGTKASDMCVLLSAVSEKNELLTRVSEKMELLTMALERNELLTEASEEIELLTEASEKNELITGASEKRYLLTGASEKSELLKGASVKSELLIDVSDKSELLIDASEKNELLTGASEKSDLKTGMREKSVLLTESFEKHVAEPLIESISQLSEFPEEDLSLQSPGNDLKLPDTKTDVLFESDDDATIELDLSHDVLGKDSNQDGFEQFPISQTMEQAGNKSMGKSMDSDNDFDSSVSVNSKDRPKKHGKGMKKSKRDRGSNLINRRQLMEDGNSSSNDELDTATEHDTSSHNKHLRQRKETLYTYYTAISDTSEGDSSNSSDEDFTSRASQRRSSKNNRKLKGDKQNRKLHQISMDFGRAAKSGHRARPTRGKKKKSSGGDKLLNSLSLLHMATLANLTETQADGQSVSSVVSDNMRSHSLQYSDLATGDLSTTFTPSLEQLSFISPQNSDEFAVSPPAACSPTDKNRWQQTRGSNHRADEITASRRLLNSQRLARLKPGCNGASNLGSKPIPFSRLISNSASPIPSNFSFNHISDFSLRAEPANQCEDAGASNTLQLLETRRAQVNCASFSMKDILRLTNTDDSMDSDSKDSAALIRPPEPKRAQVKSTSLSMSDILKLTSVDKTTDMDNSQSTYSLLSLLSNPGPCSDLSSNKTTEASSQQTLQLTCPQQPVEDSPASNYLPANVSFIKPVIEINGQTIEAATPLFPQVSIVGNSSCIPQSAAAEASPNANRSDTETQKTFAVEFSQLIKDSCSDTEMDSSLASPCKRLLGISTCENTEGQTHVEHLPPSTTNISEINQYDCAPEITMKYNGKLESMLHKKKKRERKRSKTHRSRFHSVMNETTTNLIPPVTLNVDSNLDAGTAAEQSLPVSQLQTTNREESVCKSSVSENPPDSLQALPTHPGEEQPRKGRLENLLDADTAVSASAPLTAKSEGPVAGSRDLPSKTHSICQRSPQTNISGTPVMTILEIPTISETRDATSMFERFHSSHPRNLTYGEEKTDTNMKIKDIEQMLKPLHPLQIPSYPFIGHTFDSQLAHSSLNSCFSYPYLWQWPVHTPGSDPGASPLNLCTAEKSPNNYSPIASISPMSPSYQSPAQPVTLAGVSPPIKKAKPLWYPWLTVQSFGSRSDPNANMIHHDTSNLYKAESKITNVSNACPTIKSQIQHSRVSAKCENSNAPTVRETQNEKHQPGIPSETQKESSSSTDFVPSTLAEGNQARLNTDRLSSCQTVSELLGNVIEAEYQQESQTSTGSADRLSRLILKASSKISQRADTEHSPAYRQGIEQKYRVAADGSRKGNAASLDISLEKNKFSRLFSEELREKIIRKCSTEVTSGSFGPDTYNAAKYKPKQHQEVSEETQPSHLGFSTSLKHTDHILPGLAGKLVTRLIQGDLGYLHSDPTETAKGQKRPTQGDLGYLHSEPTETAKGQKRPIQGDLGYLHSEPTETAKGQKRPSQGDLGYLHSEPTETAKGKKRPSQGDLGYLHSEPTETAKGKKRPSQGDLGYLHSEPTEAAKGQKRPNSNNGKRSSTTDNSTEDKKTPLPEKDTRKILNSGSKNSSDCKEKQLKEVKECGTDQDITVRPVKAAPSREAVEQNLHMLGLNCVQPPVAHCSNPEDLPDRPMEHGGRVLKVESKRLSELDPFITSQHIVGIKLWRSHSLSSSKLLASQGRPLRDRLEQLQFLLTGEQLMVVAPVCTPPTRRSVQKWLQNKMVDTRETKPADSSLRTSQSYGRYAVNAITDEKHKKFEGSFNISSLNSEQLSVKLCEQNKREANLDVSMGETDSQTSVPGVDSSPCVDTDLDLTCTPSVTPVPLERSEQRSVVSLTTPSFTRSQESSLTDSRPVPRAQRKRKLRFADDGARDVPEISSPTESQTLDEHYKKTKKRMSTFETQTIKPAIPTPSFDSLSSTPMKESMEGLQDITCTPIRSPQEGTNQSSEDAVGVAHRTAEDPEVAILRHISTNTESLLRKTILTSQTQRQVSDLGLNEVSQIEGPTPRNSFGFKVAQTHMQDSKVLHKYQNVTAFSVELHLETRGDLRPDPEFDAVKALFYSVLNDIPPEKSARNITGVLVVDEDSWNKINERKGQEQIPGGACGTSAVPVLSQPAASVAAGPDQMPSPPEPTAHALSQSTAPTPGNILTNSPKPQTTQPGPSIPSSGKGKGKGRPVPAPGTGGTTGDALLEKCAVEGMQVTYVRDEFDLIDTFTQLVIQFDPDILVGFEIQMLSWGYLLQRAAQLNVDLCSKISRVQDAKNNNHFSAEKDEWGADHTSEIHVAGRIVLNLWRVLRYEITLNVYSFENVAYHVLHERVPLYSFRCLTKWYSQQTHLHRWRVFEHYFRRVKGQLDIIDQLDLIGKTSEFARVFGIEFYDVLARGSQIRVESMMLRLAKPMNFVPVSPGVNQRARQRAPECIPLNLEPESKYYTSPVAVLDFQSLYPSIMIAYNYCFTTCLGRLESLEKAHEGAFEFGCTSLNLTPAVLKKIRDFVTVSPNGVAFLKSSVRKGILPIMVEEILNTRLMVKKSMKAYKDDKILSRMLDARQLGLKLIANVTYGYTGANFSGRMPCVEVADSIVRKARESLERAIELVRNTPRWGAHVVYGDTDSMFIHFPGRSKDEAFVLGQEIADAVTDMFPKPMKLRFEKIYLPCVLQTKKRYVGFMYETQDQTQPVYDAKGIETVRRDACSAVSKILERSIKVLFSTHDLSRVKQYVTRQLHKLLEGKVSIIDLIFAKEYRGLAGYKPGVCIPSLEIARRRLRLDRRSEPRVGERVPYVIVHGSPGLPLIQLVKEPSELVEDTSLRLNATYYITKQILPPLDRIFSLIGVNIFKWYLDMPKVVRVGPVMGATVSNKQGTISQFFATNNCPVCDAQTKMPVCEQCRKDPQLVTFMLTRRIQDWEKTYSRLTQVCAACQGTPDCHQTCVSIDCPIMFRRIIANNDLVRADNLQEILTKYLQF